MVLRLLSRNSRRACRDQGNSSHAGTKADTAHSGGSRHSYPGPILHANCVTGDACKLILESWPFRSTGAAQHEYTMRMVQQQAAAVVAQNQLAAAQHASGASLQQHAALAAAQVLQISSHMQSLGKSRCARMHMIRGRSGGVPKAA